MVKVGDELIHPDLGVMSVVAVVKTEDEFIDGEWRSGFKITADFDRFIKQVRWKNNNGQSRLIFHSYYLKNLEVK